MTNFQKNEITRLRKSGAGYIKIAQALGVSENTVKSFCRRNGLVGNGGVATDCAVTTHCRHCTKPLGATNQAVRRFCSTACRMAWWAAHPGHLNRKAVYSFICLQCTQPFTAYGNTKRRYCTRACFASARRARG